MSVFARADRDALSGTFFVYFALRVVGLAYHSISLSTLSFDVLAVSHLGQSSDRSLLKPCLFRLAHASCFPAFAACFSQTA